MGRPFNGRRRPNASLTNSSTPAQCGVECGLRRLRAEDGHEVLTTGGPMNKLLPKRFRKCIAPAIGCLVVGVGFAGVASAQRVTFLENIPGLTELQRNVAVAVDT